MGHGLVHWSANFDEIQDFENDIRNHQGGSGFMTNADFNATSNTLGTAKAGKSNDLDALAAYVASLSTVGKSPFRDADGTLSAAGEAGQAVFNAKGCATCHIPDQGYRDGLSHNVGTIKTTSGQRLGATLSAIDTPTLLGLWNSAPYFHDGSAADIQATLTQAHIGTGVTLTTAQKNQLADFLLELETNGATPPTDPNAPAIPTNVSAAAVSTTEVTLTYTDASSDETGFDLEYKLTTATTWTAITDGSASSSTGTVKTASFTDLTAGTAYNFRVRSYRNSTPSDWATANTSTQSNPSTGNWVQSSGLLVMEAEKAVIVAGTGASVDPAWATVTSTDASGGSAMGSPNTPTAYTTRTTSASSALKFDATFNSTGSHYLWVRARSLVANGSDNSVSYSLDGNAIVTLNTANSTSWTWTKASAAINISSAEVHTLRLHVRENGTQIDKVILTTNSAYPTPTGTGPAETLGSTTTTPTTPTTPTTGTLFEAEVLTQNASDTVTTINETAASGGSHEILSANAVGDFVEYTVDVPAASTYTISVRYKGHSSRGTAQLKVGTSPLGSAFDQRKTGYLNADLGAHALSSGPQVFRFEVTGTSGTGYTLSIDSITLTP
jgi:hypothetical protein